MANNAARPNNCSFNQMNDIVLRQFYDTSHMVQAQQPQQQSYSFVAQQHMPQYYEPQMGLNNNMYNYNMTPILAQGSIPSWYSAYQQQQQQRHPYTTYNHCYGNEQQPQQHYVQSVVNGSNRVQLIPDMSGPFYQSISGAIEQQQPTAVAYRRQAEQASQTVKVQAPRPAARVSRPTAGGRERCPTHDQKIPRSHLKPFPLDCCTSLNRSNSINSFRDRTGSRIRDSEQDMEEYRRIAARTLHKARKNRTKTMKYLDDDDNASIKSNMSSGAVRFLRRLGALLKLRSDRGSLFSLLRKRTKAQPKYPSPESRRTKQRFFKHLFGEVHSENLHAKQKSLGNIHYPTDAALESLEEREVRDAQHFNKLHEKAKREKIKNYN